MRRCLACLVGLVLVFSLSSCAKQPVMIERVLVKNATSGRVTDVKVLHEPTRKFGAVNAILPDEAMEIGLSASGQPLLATLASIRWKDDGGLDRHKTLEIPYDPAAAQANRPMILEYTLFPSGLATVALRER